MKRFFVKVARKLKVLPYLNLESAIWVHGKRVAIPLMGEIGYRNMDLLEPFMTEVLARLKPIVNGWFVDVGVNLGQTLVKAYSVFDNPHYTGFEPNFTCLHYTQELIRLNGYKNCTLLPVGLSVKTEVLKLNFYYDDKVDASASIVPDFRPSQPVHHSVYVPVFDHASLGSLLEIPPAGHPILKIDVEGAELEVLTSLREWIAKCRPVIVLEVLPAYSKENTFRLARQARIQDLLREWDYQIGWIKKGAQPRLQEVAEIPMHGDMNDSDFMFFPRSLAPKIRDNFK